MNQPHTSLTPACNSLVPASNQPQINRKQALWQPHTNKQRGRNCIKYVSNKGDKTTAKRSQKNNHPYMKGGVSTFSDLPATLKGKCGFCKKDVLSNHLRAVTQSHGKRIYYHTTFSDENVTKTNTESLEKDGREKYIEISNCWNQRGRGETLLP